MVMIKLNWISIYRIIIRKIRLLNVKAYNLAKKISLIEYQTNETIKINDDPSYRRKEISSPQTYIKASFFSKPLSTKSNGMKGNNL